MRGHRPGRAGVGALIAVLLGAAPVAAWAPSAHAAAPPEVVCRFDAGFREVSGLAASTQHPGILWLHEDSGAGPFLHAIDASTCRTVASLRVRDADGGDIAARDLEGIAMGTMPDGSPAIWLGDIGDNRDSWPWVQVLRIREPETLRDRSVRAVSWRFTYPDRPHNAEALLANGTRLWVVTKQLARGALYALPDPLRSTAVNRAERIRGETGLVTDGAIAPDGSRYVLRDYFGAQLFAGLPPGEPGPSVDLPAQRQGEAITFSADGTALYVASEQDRRLFRVSLPGSDATVSAGSPSPAAPSGASTGASSAAPAEGSNGDGPPWLAIGLAGIAIIGVFVAAERRRRRG